MTQRGRLSDFSEARAAAFEAIRILARVLSRHFLRPTTELCLERDIAGTLHRSHEAREILLLGLDDRDPLLLQRDGLIDQRTDVLLIGVRGSELDPQLSTRLALAGEQLLHLRREARVRLLELRHLVIAQPESLLGHRGHALPQLLLEHRALSTCACGLRANRHGAREHCRHYESCRPFHGSNHDQRPSAMSTANTGSGSELGSASKSSSSSISC